MKKYNKYELQFINLLESGHLESSICEIMELSPLEYEIMYNRLYCTKNGKLII